MVEIKIGQVWEDKDKRSFIGGNPRRMVVRNIDGNKIGLNFSWYKGKAFNSIIRNDQLIKRWRLIEGE